MLLIAAALLISIRNTIYMKSFPPTGKGKLERVSDLDQLTKDTKELALLFLEKCDEKGLPVKIIETYRTQERQDDLYRQGREKPGNIVTWTRDSVHTKRRAFDIMKKGDDPFGDEDFFRECAQVGRSIGLECGYYWDVKDSGHFQNMKWYNRFWY